MSDEPAAKGRARAPFVLLLLVGLGLCYLGLFAALGRLRAVVLTAGLVTTAVVTAVLLNRLVRPPGGKS